MIKTRHSHTEMFCLKLVVVEGLVFIRNCLLSFDIGYVKNVFSRHIFHV